MAETVALSKFACPSCGGEAIWNPAKQKLVCPFCGTESPAKLDAGGAIVEHDLVAALRGIGDDARGWQADKRQVKCQSCNAISVLDPKRQAQNCEFCGSAQLVPYEETKPAFRPESVLPFTVSEAAARDAHPRVVRQAVARAVRAQAPRADRHGARHLPAVLDVRRARRRRVDRRGRPLLLHDRDVHRGRPDADARRCSTCAGSPPPGTLQHFFDDDLVCASVGVHPELLRGIEPFPTQDAQALRRRVTSPAGSSSATRSTSSPPRSARATRWTRRCRRCARSRFRATRFAISSCASDYSGQTFKHILAPVWLLSYTYGARAFQCAMNGVTGAIRGEYPKSPWKIALLVLAIFIVVVIVLSFSGGR